MAKIRMSKEEREYHRQEHADMHMAVAFEIVGPHSLHVTFDDGTDRTIDFEPALRTVFTGPMYEMLLDPEYFAKVVIAYGHLTWPNGYDFNPAYVYNWPKWVESWMEREAAARV